MNITILPYEVMEILDYKVDLLMLMDIDDKWLPTFELRRFDVSPYFIYKGESTCDFKVGLRGFISIKMGEENGHNYSQMTRIDDCDVDFRGYDQIFDDFHNDSTPFSYESHFRDWKLNRLLDD